MAKPRSRRSPRFPWWIVSVVAASIALVLIVADRPGHHRNISVRAPAPAIVAATAGSSPAPAHRHATRRAQAVIAAVEPARARPAQDHAHTLTVPTTVAPHMPTAVSTTVAPPALAPATAGTAPQLPRTN